MKNDPTHLKHSKYNEMNNNSLPILLKFVFSKACSCHFKLSSDFFSPRSVFHFAHFIFSLVRFISFCQMLASQKVLISACYHDDDDDDYEYF